VNDKVPTGCVSARVADGGRWPHVVRHVAQLVRRIRWRTFAVGSILLFAGAALIFTFPGLHARAIEASKWPLVSAVVVEASIGKVRGSRQWGPHWKFSRHISYRYTAEQDIQTRVCPDDIGDYVSDDIVRRFWPTAAQARSQLPPVGSVWMVHVDHSDPRRCGLNATVMTQEQAVPLYTVAALFACLGAVMVALSLRPLLAMSRA
jgi:hypothetical protein